MLVGTWQVDPDNPLARHKALNYWERRLALEKASALGFDEVLSLTVRWKTPQGSNDDLIALGDRYLVPTRADWCLCEGSRTNVFIVRDDVLLTPSLKGPIVPGVMRALVLELARPYFSEVREVDRLKLEELQTANEMFLTNSVRGIIPVARVDGRTWGAPGPWTQRISILATDWLNQGGTAR